MKGMATKKSHSGWWNCHISPRNSKWLSENLQETDRLFNEMLKLIEEDGDSFAKKAQMYYQRRPELVSHVESFYRLYRALAERYDSITSELAKNIPTELQYQGSMNGSEFGTEATSPSVPSSPEQSSEHKPNHLKPHLKTACFEVYLGLRESFDRSRKGSDESSSESGSDYDNSKVLEAFEKSTKLEARIIELENELNEARDKLLKVMNGSKEHCELLDYFSTTSSLENQPIVANKIFAELMKQNEELQAVLSDRVEEIENLKEAMRAVEKRFDNEISCRENIIKEFKTWIGALLNKFVQEDPSPGAVEFKSGNAEEEKDEEEHMSDQNSSLEIETLNEKAIGAHSFNMLLQENTEEKDKDEQTADQNSNLEIETLNEKTIAAQYSDLLLQERSELETEISSLIVSTSSYRSKLQLFEERVKQLETEKSKICTESEKRASELNQSLDEFKMRFDTLTLERDELNAQVVNLIEDIEIWDDESRKIDEQLHVLHAEHAKLIQEVEEARIASEELTNRVNELEDVVESQRAVIVDCAEGKKEAIRQLCISLEHYRIGYQELRQIMQMKFKCLNS